MSNNIDEKDKKAAIRVFQLDDERGEFEELEIPEDKPLYSLLDSKLVLYFVDPSRYRSFIWIGSEATNHMKFIAAKTASNVRDSISPAISISSVDEGDETHLFKVIVGLEEEKENVYEQEGPIYEGKIEDDELLKELSLDKILAILEKTPIPVGFTREYVIYEKDIYAYQEYYNEYMGEVIKERKLYRLENPVPDGTYIAKGMIARVILRYNKVVLTELLRPLSEEERRELAIIEEKLEEAQEQEIDKPFIDQMGGD